MKKGLLSNKKGFTLLEVLIAVTIFSVGLLAIGEMTVHVIKSNAVGNKMTDAKVLAEEKLEELRGLFRTNPADPQLGGGSDTSDISTDIHSNTGLFTSPDHTDTCDSGCSVTIGQALQRVWNVTDNTPFSGMTTVTVIVGWHDSIDHYVALSTILMP